MTLASLQLILGVLEPKSSKEELMENEEEEEEGGAGTSEEGGDGSSEGEGSEMDEDERGSLVSEDEGSDDAGQGEEGEEEVDPAFRAEVQNALGAAAVDSDAEVFYITTAIIMVHMQWPILFKLNVIFYVDRVRAPLMMMP